MTNDEFREAMNECLGLGDVEGLSIGLKDGENAGLEDIQESVFNIGSSLARKYGSNLTDWIGSNKIDDETRTKIVPQLLFGFMKGASEVFPELGISILEKEGKCVN